MAASALPITLRSITATKIAEVKKQREQFEEVKHEIEQDIKNQATTYQRAVHLLKGIAKLDNVYMFERSGGNASTFVFSGVESRRQKLSNQSRLLYQSQVDPAFPQVIVEQIEQDLKEDLQLRANRHAHAQFFSELVTEWIGADKPKNKESASSKFEHVGRKEMHEQRQQWEDIVFSKKTVDVSTIETYLSKLFLPDDQWVNDATEAIRKSSETFSQQFADKEPFDIHTLKVQIKGLIATDLLSHTKVGILKTFLSNNEVLKEVADVLNMRFKSLVKWNWTLENGAINVEQRRQLNGKYRVFMDQDVLDAILVHYVGIEWAVHFRAVFKTFFKSHAWQREQEALSTKVHDRCQWFLGSDTFSSNIETLRRNTYEADYFMTQLPEAVNSSSRNAYANDDDDPDDGTPSTQKNPLEIKHNLLHLLVTEAMLARHQRPEINHGIIRSDFKWFGPSLHHESISTTLKFFGVSDMWLDFFTKFLRIPLRFEKDGPNGTIRIRSTGVPISHSLSDTMAEVVLFVMDFAVNSSTKTNLYRLHDDFWLWGNQDLCERGWQEMKTFAATMGIEFNMEKTGSVTISADGTSKGSRVPVNSDSEDSSLEESLYEDESYPDLPTGDITWGFLKLDPDTARFRIDQKDVDKHIQELRLQLDATDSIFGYVQAWNSYGARFFTNNLGKPSFAFGHDHINEIISTFKRIHEALYPNGRVIDHLSKLAERRFNVAASDISNGFWYFPVRNGGMELRNPIVPLLNMRESLTESPDDILKTALTNDKKAYEEAKLQYKLHATGYGMVDRYGSRESAEDLKQRLKMTGDEPFMSLEEYLKYREYCSLNLGHAYEKLLKVPQEVGVDEMPDYKPLLATVPHEERRGSIKRQFQTMDPYWKWIVAVYGKEIMDAYGGLQMLDPAQVPLGVVSIMKSSKVQWQG